MLAYYYNLIYIIIVILFAIPIISKYSNGWDVYEDNRSYEPISKSLLFVIFITLFIGFRPNSSVFADGAGYWVGIEDHRWEKLSVADVDYQFATKYLMSFMSYCNFSPRIGFIVLASVVYGGAFIAMRKMFPSDTMLAMILYCGTFGVFGGAVNGIKSGMACSMFLCALAYREQWKTCLIFLFLSFGFHHSLELSIGAFILCIFYQNTNNYYILWCVSLVLAILHVTYFQTFFAGFTDEHGASYLLTNENSVVSGFKLDFVLYSAAPLALGWWVKSKIDITGTRYQYILNVYMVMNSIWLLCMYAAATNRFASLSWSIFPILILEPLLKESISDSRHKVLIWFVIGQLAFTLLMGIVGL